MVGQLSQEKPSFSSRFHARFPMFNNAASGPLDRCLEICRSRVFQRLVAALTAFVVFMALLGTLLHVNPGGRFPELPEQIEDMVQKIHFDVPPTCSSLNNTGNVEIWKEGLKKYENLRDDKFTIAIQTYRRPKPLEKTLETLLEGDNKIPSLLEVVIVWNDLENDPPQDYKSRHGIPVRYRVSEVNSLNSRLLPDKSFQTQAILLSDDDVFYQPLDLEFAFQKWRQYGRDRLTGAMARCTNIDADGHGHYTYCRSNRDERYNLIITNLAFAHIRFLDYYSSDDPVMTKIRAYVDKHFNCEDIAMNYVTSLVTGQGPLLVFGDQPFVNQDPPGGISMKKNHFENRSKCVDHFSELFGCFPLVDTSEHLGLGGGRHKWDGYKADYKIYT